MSNRRWDHDGDTHVLLFTPYYDEETVAIVYQGIEGEWCYDSELTGKEEEYLDTYILVEAKEEVERLIEEHYQDQVNYYTEVLQHFREG